MKEIKIKEAKELLASKTLPNLIRAEKNAISGLIEYAIKNGELRKGSNGTLDWSEFLWWSSEKTFAKKSDGLRWPWIKEEIEIPRKTRTGKTTLTLRHIPYPHKENWEEAFVECWSENNKLKEEIKVLKKENEMLKVKRKKRKEDGEEAAKKQWDK